MFPNKKKRYSILFIRAFSLQVEQQSCPRREKWSKRFERQEIDVDRSPSRIHKSRQGGWLVGKTIGRERQGDDVIGRNTF